MNYAVVYYSMDGHTKGVATKVAKKLSAKLVRLECNPPYPKTGAAKFLKGGSDALFDRQAKLAPYEFDERDFDVVILASPMWAGKASPAMNRFLHEHVLTHKRIGLISLSKSGRDGCLVDMRRKLYERGTLPTADAPLESLNLTEEESGNEAEVAGRIDNFCDRLGKLL